MSFEVGDYITNQAVYARVLHKAAKDNYCVCLVISYSEGVEVSKILIGDLRQLYIPITEEEFKKHFQRISTNYLQEINNSLYDVIEAIQLLTDLKAQLLGLKTECINNG